MWNWQEVILNFFSPAKASAKGFFFTIRTICWKISVFYVVFYLTAILTACFNISAAEYAAEQYVIPKKARKGHQIGISLLWVFWLRIRMEWEVLPCLILGFVFRRGIPNSFSWSSGSLGQVGSLFVRKSHFRIASGSSLVWWIFLFHRTASRLKNSWRISFPGFNKLLPNQL